MDTKYRNAWVESYSNYNSRLKYKTFQNRSDAKSIIEVQYDSDKPGRYGRIVYRNTNSKYSTPFRTYLNTSNIHIRNSANVRRSTASHELGHALGLKELEDKSKPEHSVMYKHRDRYSVIRATSLDIIRIDKLY
ncbi:hypothetical protein [Evansella clarkii]|uniref:hypothetical protein n=1 Tax=Evansella clarkii TaxID=79879 RepID=UPI00142F6084|nr:hypothetical protein [Evansella clarkii]